MYCHPKSYIAPHFVYYLRAYQIMELSVRVVCTNSAFFPHDPTLAVSLWSLLGKWDVCLLRITVLPTFCWIVYIRQITLNKQTETHKRKVIRRFATEIWNYYRQLSTRPATTGKSVACHSRLPWPLIWNWWCCCSDCYTLWFMKSGEMFHQNSLVKLATLSGGK